jgi:hypothetical protein
MRGLLSHPELHQSASIARMPATVIGIMQRFDTLFNDQSTVGVRVGGGTAASLAESAVRRDTERFACELSELALRYGVITPQAQPAAPPQPVFRQSLRRSRAAASAAQPRIAAAVSAHSVDAWAAASGVQLENSEWNALQLEQILARRLEFGGGGGVESEAEDAPAGPPVLIRSHAQSGALDSPVDLTN